ncbi:23S rRNA (adenine(2503)-C(2))-methyltransferase RlmN [Candidatus Roizmanbacteria bacterium]|nr:23S rRNA (adenine(2503)-C(2))-methyltransferase RlmN [Candidatus Roizmanbacteria bacterium]
MINAFAHGNNLPSFRLKQFNEAYYRQFIGSYDELTTWPKDLRTKLSETIPFTRLSPTKTLISQNKDVYKVAFQRLADKQQIEAVLMRHEDGRNTVCVSCMVGCPVNCSFCATGKMGFRGNLTADEIVDQVLYFCRICKELGETVTNVVYMGMGEPMLNLPEVEKSIAILTDPEKMGLGDRRITVSTSGYIPQFKQFISSGYKGRIALSLHAPNQQIREKIMPIAKVFKFDDLINAMDEYTKLSNKRITYEYILINGINDELEHAESLSRLLRNRLAHVNLIPYNTVTQSPYQRPSNNRLFRFAEVLKEHGIPYTLRVTMGDDIKAACGQLSSEDAN